MEKGKSDICHKKTKKKKNVTFNCIEEFKTNSENINEESLKRIFNKKYYNFVKTMENCFIGDNSLKND